MRLLPGQTALPTQPIKRSHAPATGHWRAYMDCLRWEFGFTCPFCLLHEGDLSEHDVKGQGLVWVEHHILRSHDGARARDYTNCLLSCRFCNNQRLARENIDKDGRRLLDPTCVAWRDHFEWDKDIYLKPKAGDRDAEYTWQAYRFDDEKQKVPRRILRRSLLMSSLPVLDLIPRCIKELDRQAERARRDQDMDTARQKLMEARQLQAHLDTTIEQLQRYLAVPRHAPASCRCDAERALPDWLARQTIEVSDPGEAA